MDNIAFIELGIMGAPMAAHLLAGGNRIFAYGRSRVSDGLITNGAVACSSSADAASKAGIIITMLPDTADLESVLFGSRGVVEGLAEGEIVANMSSISPIATKDFAQRINKLGRAIWMPPFLVER
jgi:2-hydroxy-3-oxopropionate reductase